MVSTDKRLHLFLKSCVKADYPDRAGTQYLNFSSITFAIELNHFNYFLQPSIKRLQLSIKPQKRILGNDEEDYLKKKISANVRITNDKMVAEWKLRAGESYETVFKEGQKRIFLTRQYFVVSFDDGHSSNV